MNKQEISSKQLALHWYALIRIGEAYATGAQVCGFDLESLSKRKWQAYPASIRSVPADGELLDVIYTFVDHCHDRHIAHMFSTMCTLPSMWRAGEQDSTAPTYTEHIRRSMIYVMNNW